MDNFTIAEATGSASNTTLKPWTTDKASLVKRLSSPVIGNKDGGYFLRCNGTTRSNAGTDDTAHILILDGDSRIDEHGELLQGAPAPEEISEVLTNLGLSHFIYSSFSNGATRDELAAKVKPGDPKINTGGAYGANFYKYRVIIPCTYTREQLPALLAYIFAKLHRDGVMLADVKEAYTWAQAWYFPRVPDSTRAAMFDFIEYEGNEKLNVEAIYSDWSAVQQVKKAAQAALSAVSRQRATELTQTGLNPMKAYKEAYPIEQLLDCYGFKRISKKWVSPHSESGNAQFMVNGKTWTSFHGSDKEADLGREGSNGEMFGDAFDLYKFFECNNNQNTAVIAAGAMFKTASGATITEQNQQNYKAAAEAAQPKVAINVDELIKNGNSKKKPKPDEAEPKKPFSMSAFSLRGQSEVMKTKMLADRFVLDRIAILGQATTIYAKPNTGKTLLVLWMLIESIKAGRIDGESVYYINADDDYKGLVFKTSLAEQYGFEMLAPGHNGFESAALQGYMAQLIADDTASGKVIILDTLKKFTDLMNKKTGSEFMNRAREFVAKGGTLIMLAHCNKNRDSDGKAVYGGTSDVSDDCDCVFMLDEVSKTITTKQVLFENLKSRGIVANELAFSYSVDEGRSYQYRLDSVELADKKTTELAKKDKAIVDDMTKNQLAINAITEMLEQGISLKTDLITAAHDCSGISKRQLNYSLEKYKGTVVIFGNLWRESVGVKNAKSYHLLSQKDSTAADYRAATDGE